MKKLVLRKWVVQVLSAIIMVALMFMVSDCESIKLFVTSHLIALVVFVGCVLILKKYARI